MKKDAGVTGHQIKVITRNQQGPLKGVCMRVLSIEHRVRSVILQILPQNKMAVDS